MSNGAVPLELYTFRNGHWDNVPGGVIAERLISIFVNGTEVATIMASPRQQKELAVGFLANEGLIASLNEVRAVHLCPSGLCVDVWLRTSEFKRPARQILTSGCGGGVTFDDLAERHPPLESDLRVAPERLWELMEELQRSATLYREVGGVHTSALAAPHGKGLVLVAEDIGRHNTVDKLRGMCLMQGLDPRDHVLLCTGRISSEMLGKARRMGVPIVASRTSPTSLSVELGRAWGVTVVGYLRRGRLTVYAGPERIVSPVPGAAPVATRNGRGGTKRARPAAQGSAPQAEEAEGSGEDENA